jgi:hypothetical protein
MAAPIALVDCNNFYASCERLFQPELCGPAFPTRLSQQRTLSAGLARIHSFARHSPLSRHIGQSSLSRAALAHVRKSDYPSRRGDKFENRVRDPQTPTGLPQQRKHY